MGGGGRNRDGDTAGQQRRGNTTEAGSSEGRADAGGYDEGGAEKAGRRSAHGERMGGAGRESMDEGHSAQQLQGTPHTQQGRTPPARATAKPRPVRPAAARGERRRRQQEPAIEHDDERQPRRRRQQRGSTAQGGAPASKAIERSDEVERLNGTKETTTVQSNGGERTMSAEEARKKGAEMQRALARRVQGKRTRGAEEDGRKVMRRTATSQYTPEQYHRVSDRGIT